MDSWMGRNVDGHTVKHTDIRTDRKRQTDGQTQSKRVKMRDRLGQMDGKRDTHTLCQTLRQKETD